MSIGGPEKDLGQMVPGDEKMMEVPGGDDREKVDDIAEAQVMANAENPRRRWAAKVEGSANEMEEAGDVERANRLRERAADARQGAEVAGEMAQEDYKSGQE